MNPWITSTIGPRVARPVAVARVRLAIGTVLATLIAITPTIAAQGPLGPSEPNASEKAGKELHAWRVTGTPPRIDGHFDEAFWEQAQTIDDFVQEDPDNNQPPAERMRIRIAYDHRNLYVAVEMFMRDMSRLIAGVGRRGSAPPSDRILIGFDASHDHRNAYIFEANVSGVQHDFLMVDDTSGNNDYEAVWDVATTVLDDRWNAEFRIPFSQMRFPDVRGGPMTWGFNVRREVMYRGEQDWWIIRPRGSQGIVSRYGHLIFAEPPATPQRLELQPFGLTKQTSQPGSSSNTSASAGVDVRLGLGPSATLSATVNPDFGQVEADPAVLNLSVFEPFFPERRPFFLEDSSIFTTSYSEGADFYSRRIGRRPGRIALQRGDRLVSQPEETTILGAAKLTGRSSGWTYGGLGTLTSREYATVDANTVDAEGQPSMARVERLIEPATFYGVGRVQRDVLRGSSIGATGTAVVREGVAGSGTIGGDASLRWKGSRYRLRSHWTATRAPVDGEIRSGVSGSSDFNYDAKYVAYATHLDHTGRNFRNADLGFLSSRTNKTQVSGTLWLLRPDPWGRLRRVNIYLNPGRSWNDQGLVFNQWVGVGASTTFTNFWGVYADITHTFERLDDLDSRGGPPILRRPSNYVGLGLFSDSRKSWRLSLGSNRERSAAGDSSTSYSGSINAQLAQRLSTSLSANYTGALDAAQWIRNLDANGDGAVDYVYGSLRRRVINITGRASYAFTRNLTLETFLQPFVAAGDYLDTKKLARPRSFAFTPVSLADNPDFTRKSLRGTVVLRWEYVRGSTLYAVWNRSAFDGSRPGEYSAWRDLGDTFQASGTNVLALKLSYWFAP